MLFYNKFANAHSPLENGTLNKAKIKITVRLYSSALM